MFTLFDFEDLIEQQLHHNQDRSLFYEPVDGQGVLSPSRETVYFIKYRPNEIANFIRSASLNGTTQYLIEYTANKTIQLFMRANQYLDFSRQDYRQLQHIYEGLFERVDRLCRQEETFDEEIDHLFRSHYKNLQAYLLESNGNEIFKKYRESPNVFAVKCTEYSPEFQMRLLRIDVSTIEQPVIDIGCGQQGSLVHFLRENGIESYGMDRSAWNITYLHQANWFDCTFVPGTWGTAISHMAFSNHFMHHHLRSDGDYKRYAKKYMEILQSLKLGGSFTYAPSLSFMEEILISSTESYTVEANAYSTKVTRIK